MNSLDPVSLGEKVRAAGETNSRPRPQNALDAFKELVYNLVLVEVESLKDGTLISTRGRFLNEVENLVRSVPALFEVTTHRRVGLPGQKGNRPGETHDRSQMPGFGARSKVRMELLIGDKHPLS